MAALIWWPAAVVCMAYGVIISTSVVWRFVSTIRTGGRGTGERYPGDTLEQQGYDERTAVLWLIASAALSASWGLI